jgi:hypothetical protein
MTTNPSKTAVPSVEPALDDLHRKQDELFRRLADGFDSRRQLLVWMHDVSLRTLGQVPDDWFANLVGTRYKTAAMLADEKAREGVSSAAADAERAAVERGVLADDTLVEACRQGMRVLSRQANEYIDGKEQVDPSAQSWLAMRPAVDDLAQRQRRVLRRALELDGQLPIDSRAAVREWVRDAVRATKGSDGGLGERVLWSPSSTYWMRSLRGDPTAATLHLLLADEYLSVANAALRTAAAAAGEQVAEERESHDAGRT